MRELFDIVCIIFVIYNDTKVGFYMDTVLDIVVYMFAIDCIEIV